MIRDVDVCIRLVVADKNYAAVSLSKTKLQLVLPSHAGRSDAES
jgi:hypothetical protein